MNTATRFRFHGMGLFVLWISILAAALAMCSCGGNTVAGGTAGGTATGGGTAGTGGTGGTNPYSGRHFVSTVYSGGQELTLTLDSSSGNELTGTLVVPPPSGGPHARGGDGISGLFNATDGSFNGTGSFGGHAISLAGSLPSTNRGGKVAVNINGVDCRGVFGEMNPNTLYFRHIDTVTDSSYAATDGTLTAGYVEGAGRMLPFTTWGGQPHDAYLGTLVRFTATSDDPVNFSADEGAIAAGSYLHVAPQQDPYQGGPPLGDCFFFYGESGKTYIGISGHIVIDKLDPANHEYLFHFEAVEVQGAGDLWGAPLGFGRFAIDGRFVGNYSESDMFGPF